MIVERPVAAGRFCRRSGSRKRTAESHGLRLIPVRRESVELEREMQFQWIVGLTGALEKNLESDRFIHQEVTS